MIKNYHFKLAVIYMVFGVLWILITDLVVFRKITDSLIHYRIETVKGIFFVVVSTALIYFTSKLLTSRIEREKERNRNLAYLLDNANDAIIVKSRDGRILYWNKGAENLYGWSRGEVIGQDLQNVIGYDIERVKDIAGNIEDKGEWFGELVNSKRDGQQITTYSRWSRISGFEGHEDSILIIISDISEVKELENRLQRIRRLENLGLLSSEIAHDLNNVIQPILMSTDILKESIEDGKLQKFIDMIRHSARRGSELVQQVLTFTKGLKSKKSYIDTKSVINEMVGIAERTFPEKVSFEHHVEHNINSIYGVRTQVDQVIMNLLVNARDAVKGNGKITLSAENFIPDDGFCQKHFAESKMTFVKVTITDNGTGIAPEIMEKIYEPFFTTKGNETGNGIGLSTCKRIISEHDGIIEVDSKVGEGTEFRIYFPSSAGEITSGLSEKLDEEYAGSGEYILVADDERFVRELLKNVLESANYKVYMADNGEDMLATLSSDAELKEKVRAVITDLEMPNIQGEELVRKLKSMKSDIRIIVISGSAELAQFEKLKNEKYNDIDSFILKPFSDEKLLNTLKETIRSSEYS